MDILCSRRANITRLQNGLGLPVRDLFPPPDSSNLPGSPGSPDSQELRNEYRTALHYRPGQVSDEIIMYRDLRQLGGYDQNDRLGRQCHFFWLWRSTLRRYDLHARIWQKWLCSAIHRWPTWQRRPDSTTGFGEYDRWVKEHRADPAPEKDYVATKNPRWEPFTKMCDGLVEALDRATPNYPNQ